MSNYNSYGGGMGGGGGPGPGPGPMSRDIRGGSAGGGSHPGQWSSSDNPNQRRNDQLGPSDPYLGPPNPSFNRERPVMPVQQQQQQQPDSFIDNKAVAMAQAQGDNLPNDCEILTISGPDDAYVNMVENAIKDIGLRVDVMIPKPSVKLSNFIENLAAKGTIFAVIVKPENVVHRSVTVHVLRGHPKAEEHRNMPLTTAYSLIQKSYVDLKRKEIGVVPEQTRNILRFMLEDRSLSDQEYAVLIAFLQERRKRQASFESRTPHGHNEKAYYSPEELQQRILTLIGGIQEPSSRPMAMDQNPMGRIDSGGYGNPGQIPGPGHGPTMDHTRSYLL